MNQILINKELRSPAAGIDENDGRNLSERAYDQLLDRMLSGELPAGTLLQERPLADALQISRTPVREALAKLESEGLVTRHVGRLLIVREIPVQELMQILHVRSILEVEAVALAADRISRAQLETLRATFEEQMQGPIPDAGNHWGADDLLHGAICEASGNAVLTEMVCGLRRRTRMFNLKRMPERFLPGCGEHLAIIEALERGDEKMARRSMATHLDNTKRSILNKLGKV
jgi:DNA-binding GntR family transcriptional regulator